MPFDIEDNTFLLAGPVKMHPRVLAAMSRPAMAHRDAQFTAVNKEIHELLKMVFQAPKHDTVLMTGSGTAGMDAAALSLLKKGEKAVAIENGKFGNRFAKLAEMYGDTKVVKAPGYGVPIPLDTIRKAIAETKPKAVFLTHNESSVGFTWPLKDIAAIAKEHGALVVADCITSVGGMDVKVADWGVDVAIVGSQKCLGAPSGLVALAVSQEAQAKMHKDAGYYLNLPRWIAKGKEADTPFTPAIPLHLAFLEALRIIKHEGLENRIAKVKSQADATRAAGEAMGLELFIEAGYRSDTVTAFRYPAGVDDSKFRKALKEMGVVIGGGQDEVKGKIFRIGHMGTVSHVEIAGAFMAIEKTLAAMGASVKKGAWSGVF
ncbi:MAG TPA: alanine--glyoxylate aminotransferase family protein [Candidatus Thermoplasmatota archaeon]|nr:alanine--glyoxylate aminotransferase family protein [Candidatus Thermoplasmatota archaeon]